MHNHQLPLLPTGSVTEIRFHKDPVAAVGYESQLADSALMILFMPTSSMVNFDQTEI